MQSQDDAWKKLRLTLRSDLRFEIRRSGGQINYVIEDSARRKFFQIGALEFEFIQRLDGRATVADVVTEIHSDHKTGNEFTEDSAKKIVQWLMQLNLVQTDCVATSDRIIKAKRLQRDQRMLAFVNPLMFRVKLFNPDRWLTKIEPLFGWIFSRWAFVGWLIVCLIALVQMCQNLDRLASASSGVLANGRWIWLIVCWVALKVIHEFGHGLACKKYGGEAPETGVLMLLLTPMAYIDVSSSWKFASRQRRMIVSAAGMYVEIFIAAIAMIWWCHTESKLVADVCFNLFLMASMTTVLFNANPLMRFDGYYMLSDAIGIVNLYTRAQQDTSSRIRYLFGLPCELARRWNRTTTTIFVYGIFAFLWRISIGLGLILAATTLLHGFGLLFAMIGAMLWLLLPIYKFVMQIVTARAQSKLNRRRFSGTVGFLLVTGFALFTFVQAPAIKSAPAIVQFKDEQIIRSTTNGFLSKIHVLNGQYVRRGQLLFELENRELQMEIARVKTDLEKSKIQSRIFRKKSELASFQAEQKKISSLETHLAEKLDEASGLRILAPFDGIVFARGLENRLGVYLERGDEIAIAAQSSNKEIKVSVDQSDWNSFENGIGKEVKLGFPGKSIFATTIDRVDPRASDRPVDPSLTVAYGGTIPVHKINDGNKSDASESVVMLSQRFTATINLDSEQSKRFQAGQRGIVYFRTPRQTLGSYLLLASQKWLRNKLKSATTTPSS